MFSSLVQNDKTCSLFLIQHETVGGLPLKEQLTRAACPACSWTCFGGFLKRNAGPAKTNKVSVATQILAAVLLLLKTPLWEETSVGLGTKMEHGENVCVWEVTTLSVVCSVHIWTVLLLQADLYYCSTLQTKCLKWKQTQTTDDLPNTSRTSPCVIKSVKQCYVQSLFKGANAVTCYSLCT